MTDGGPSDHQAEDEEVFEFDCPECGTHIVGDVAKCPSCGVEFVIEEVEEFECPECGGIVPYDALACPHCGIEFEALDIEGEGEEGPEEESLEGMSEKDLQKEFPSIVAEIKPMLILANKYGIDSSEARRLIDKTVTAGKRRDILTAVRLARTCRASIKEAVEERIVSDQERLEKLVEVAGRMGVDPEPIEGPLKDLREARDKDVKAALDAGRRGREAGEELTGKYVDATALCDSLERLIEMSERFYIDVRESRAFLSEARDAGESGDYGMMHLLAQKGRRKIADRLPDFISEEMNNSRNVLLEAKVEGKDVSTLVKILKEASVAVKRDNQEAALERLVEFKTELRRL